MQVAVIPVRNEKDVLQHLNAARQYAADAVELRLDYLQPLDFNLIAALRSQITTPVIFTLRNQSEGGYYFENENNRLQAIEKLCQLNPDFFDMEATVPQVFLEKINKHFPTIKLIGSYHHFSKTPIDLSQILNAMKHRIFYAYKIATETHNSLDALRLMIFLKNRRDLRLSVIGMGEAGQCTRILGPVLGNFMNYASVDSDSKTAPGQMTLKELKEIYRVHQLNPSSKIYALLGDPINYSVGHFIHNKALTILKQNAVYLKIKVTQQELPTFMQIARELPFAGFSVTMPLKEMIIKYLDERDENCHSIKAINTVSFKNSRWIGFNTDGWGALLPLKKRIDLTGKTVIVLGAGGAAAAIAHALKMQNAKLIILNRNPSRATALAIEVGAEGYGLDKIMTLKNYDVLINTLPLSAYEDKNIQTLLIPDILKKSTIAMDIVYQPIQTYFIKIAEKANCICIKGFEMYREQALLQIDRWFQPDDLQKKNIEKMMRDFFNQSITSPLT